MSDIRRVIVPMSTWTAVTDQLEVYQVLNETAEVWIYGNGSIGLASHEVMGWVVRVRQICACGAGGASAEYHDVIACPVGRAQYGNDHPDEVSGR